VMFLTEDLLKGTDWRALERAVARLAMHCGWENVSVIGGSGDMGADILATRQDNQRNLTWVIQVKAVTGGNYVGVGSVNEALRAQSVYGTNVAVVATNGDFTGSARTRCNQLRASGFDVRLWNGAFLRELLLRWPIESFSRRTPREYQEAISNRCVAEFLAGARRVQYVLATGLGKTLVAAEVVSRLWDRGLRRVLVLCHTQELALQLEQGFWPQLSKDVPTHVFMAGAPPLLGDGVNFGLYQTLLNYAANMDPSTFDIVVVDEAHHALAHGFRTCIESLQPSLLMGMTATPWRGDGLSIDEVFGEPIARLSLVDGMNMGYLARVDYRLYCDNIDWATVHQLSRQRLSVHDLNKRLFLPQRDEAVAQEVARQAKELPNPRTIVFCPSVDHAERFCKFLSSVGMPAVNLSITDRYERHRRLLLFGSGSISAVTAVDVLNEGIDLPNVNMIVFLRSTHSRRIFVQQLGRGLRIAADKSVVRVLDFVADIRRMADVADLGHEVTAKQSNKEVVYLSEASVSFSNTEARTFVEAWLADISDLGSIGDDDQLVFPDME